jgi:ATP-dependent exoDNAse (exonuclease V) beta subunit
MANRNVSPATSANADDARRLVIRASAGSGKTYQLSTRYIARLQLTDPDRILATTFTRKAAGEILERILRRLAEAGLDAEKRSDLAATLGGPQRNQARCLEQLTTLTRQLHRVRVSTLDSFFSRIAGAFALELGLPPGWGLLDQVEDDQLRAAAIEAVLREGDQADLLQLVHLLAKGDAVRGVTRLIRDTIDELYAVFLLTPAKAWREIDGPRPLDRAELHAAIMALAEAELPADKRWESGRQADVDAAAAGDWESFVIGGIAGKILEGEATYHKKPIQASLRAVYDRLLRHATAIELKVLSQQLGAAHDLLQRFHAEYERLKHAARGLTFDDVTRRLAAELSGQDAAGLAFRLDAQIDHLLLDEFQDTSLSQWQVLEPIAESVVRQPDGSFFCVGDVKQAIYGWRGGVAGIFNTVTSRLSGLAQQTLDRSYRSAPAIIETVNSAFANLGRHPDLEDAELVVREWARAFPRHTTNKTDLPGYACLRTVAAHEGPESPADKVYRAAAQHIAELLGRVPQQLTIGVLARRNEAVGQMIHELRRLDVPASEEGGNPLTDSAAVQLVLSALTLADHPGHSVAWFHVAHSPLGPVVELSPEDDPAARAAWGDHLRRELVERGYGSVLYDWLRALAPACNARELNRLRQLVALADGYEPFATLRPTDFVAYVEKQHVEDPRAARVRVMTIHKAKGLEFDIVVLPQLDDPLTRPPEFVTRWDDPGAPPTRVCRYRNRNVQRMLPREIQKAFEQTHERAVQESLCVLYVALTRAAHALYMFVAPKPQTGKSHAGLLRYALAENAMFEPDRLLYECGDADWHQRVKPADGRIPSCGEAPPPVSVRIAPAPAGRRRGRDFFAPSHYQPHRTLHVRDIVRAADRRTLDRGTLVHAWFELIDWLDDDAPSDDQLQQVARRLGQHDEDVAHWIAEFRALLQKPSIQRLLSRKGCLADAPSLTGMATASACDLRVQAERRFDVPIDGGILSGSIDRLVLFCRAGVPVAADILDFKTDGIAPGDLFAVTRLVDHYRDQLGAYVHAVSVIYGIAPEHISTRLVLLATGEIVPVRR